MMATDIERIKQYVKSIYSLSISPVPDRQKIADAEKQLLILLEYISAEALLGDSGILFFNSNADHPTSKYKNSGQIIFRYCSYRVVNSVLESMEEADGIALMAKYTPSSIKAFWDAFQHSVDLGRKKELLNRIEEIDGAIQTARRGQPHIFLKNKYSTGGIKCGMVVLLLSSVLLIVVGIIILHSLAIGGPLIGIGCIWLVHGCAFTCAELFIKNKASILPFKVLKNNMPPAKLNIVILLCSLIAMGLGLTIMELITVPVWWIALPTLLLFALGAAIPPVLLGAHFMLMRIVGFEEAIPDHAFPTPYVSAAPSLMSENKDSDDNKDQNRKDNAIELSDIQEGEISHEMRPLLSGSH